ncbi:hypothetical protein NM688_g1287 [Phlebia brevispora]|uniref:Uncharacterized protein n=1 Tax=Phlebia brevispora TaxID=194682 RepID=A0ACC1TBL8_9APHY|nr:hypothetical protein NM688_g1287 [Phlebia brevispora]
MFNDVWFQDTDGSIMLDDPNKHTLDVNYPIREIRISSSAVIEGIEVTYSLANAVGAATISHGSRFSEADKVCISAHETLVGVFGRAGFQTEYERKLITNIGFMLFDSQLAAVRVAGPFGSLDPLCEGEAFYVSDVIAFGGFAQNDKHLGLSGLFFIKQRARD